ncbi:recombinase family protein [Vibrio splendidus]|uniref:recombinase family protein n=1 Tax=Vibrio splendidus TaxID=29497 RepID=UPI001F53754D|nr:recombinase family protein [Vibrio splendidus]
MSSNLSNTTTPKIYSYTRVSTLEQKKGSGVAMQINDKVLEALALEHQLPLAEETYQDLGKSAFHGQHLKHELGTFLQAIKDGVIAKGSIIVVYSLDRLSRLEIGHAKQTYLDLTNNGVSVYSIVDNHLYRAHNAADDIIATITFERAHNESKNKSSRVIDASKQGLKRWKETGEPQSSLGRSPFWIDQPTNEFNINAAGVKKAIEMKIAGYGDLKIKKYLDNHFEYKPTRRKGKVKQSNTWDYIAISKLWRRRSLTGENSYTIEGVTHVMENYYPALIDDDTFRKLQVKNTKKQGRDTSSGKIPLLKSLARCGTCGGAMVFVDKGESRINYVCNLAMKGEHAREVYNVNMLDLLTLEVCKDAYLSESSKSHNIHAEQQKLKLETELFEQQESRDNLRDYYKATPSKTLLDLIIDSESKIIDLEAKLDAINTNTVELNADELSNLPEVYTESIRTDYLNPTRHEIRNNLRRFISSITLNRSEEPCPDAKTKVANCIDITWHFKNAQKRRLAMLPYQFTKAVEGDKTLYLPYAYMYGSKSNIKVEDGDQFLSNIFNKLHSLDLTRFLYPSRGRYQWSNLNLECGKTYWAPLDRAVFIEQGMEHIAFTERGTPNEAGHAANYLSLMFNYPSSDGGAYDYPDSKFIELACKFGFVEEHDFSLFLQDNQFNQELYSSLDFLMS